MLIPTNSGGNFTATYGGTTLLDGAYLDSGSTALFFADLTIPHASNSENSLYIPTTTAGRTATLFAGTSTTASVGFNVANGLTLSWSGKQRLQRHRRVLERNAGLRSAVLLRAACVLRLRG